MADATAHLVSAPASLDRLSTEGAAVDLISSNDPRYDDARAVFNAVIGKRPAVIAQCATPDEVILALELARRTGYGVAVRAGGRPGTVAAWTGTS